MSFAPSTPYQPYASVHEKTNGPDDGRPTALQVIKDADATGALKGKTILITGCSSGIGVETARALYDCLSSIFKAYADHLSFRYETGAKLFLTARDIPKLEKVIDGIVSSSTSKDTPRPESVEIHLDSLDSVRKGAEDFKQRSNGQLNILINNAGVMVRK